MRKLVPQSAYARNVITLMTGTGLAQAIPIAISPILTRLYSPEDFGVFAVYMAIVSIASVLVTGRYELAIILPEQDRDAMNIVALAILLSSGISALLLLIVILFNQSLSRLLGAPELAGWLYWVPASTLLMGIYQSLNYWSNRQAQYKRLAISRTVQSGTASLAQLGGSHLGPVGLVGGQITGQLLATGVLSRMIWREDYKIIQKIKTKHMKKMAVRYMDYPKFMIFGQIFNTASGYMPLFLLGIFFGAPVVGFYSLSERVIASPMALVGGAIGDVYRSEAAKIYQKNGNCIQLYRKTIFRLFFVSAAIAAPIFFFGPNIFSIIFGREWKEAGELASILAIMIFFRGISSPTSQTILLADMQRFDLIWQILRLLFSVISLYVGYKFFSGYAAAVYLFVISFSFLYIVHSIFQYHVAKGGK